jgi:large-conductance mechanosensitive channel
MLLQLSAFLVLIYTAISILKVYRHKNKLVNMTGMTIAMLLVMASSLVIGLIAGIAFKSDLTISTIIAVSFSIIVGALVGRIISLLALVEGIAGGVMGGMMGAMLGEMLPSDNFKLMLVFTDVLFIASFLFIIILINTELKKHNDKHEPITLYPRTFPWVLTTVISAVIILTFAQLETKPVLSKSNVQEMHHNHE